MHRALQRIHELRAEGKSQRAIAQILEAEGVPFPPGRYKKWNHTAVVRLLRQERLLAMIEGKVERSRRQEQEQERAKEREQERECDAGWKAELQFLELQHERHALAHQRLQLELERLLARLERRDESPSGILPHLLSAAVGILAGGVMVMTMLYQPPSSPAPRPPLPFTAPPPLPSLDPPPRPPWEKAHAQAPALTGR